jgi:predicted MFS family arabinose efflux permease
VDFVLLVFGISALLGIWVIGLWVDHRLRALVLLSLGVFIVIVAALQFGGTLPLVVYAAVAAWGFIFGGAPTLLQTASADTAGENADTAQSMVVTAWNLAIAGGGAVGGALLATKGVVSFTELLLTLLLLGFFVAWRAGTHGFIPGKRAALQ